MFRLHTFGSLDLIGPDGRSLDTILAQPKRSLLLAYLASATPRGYQRRDVLVALFWPELDAERARGALRKALHFLRATLGDAVITRGDEVAVESSMLSCDAVEFERALAQGRLADAMALYRGDFLPGVFAKDAPDVERWIQAERSRLRALAAGTAWNLAESAEQGDASGAARWAAVAWSLAPDDEGALRKTMMLLDRVGAKAAALRAYDDFATSLAADFPGAMPASATRELRDALLERAAPAALVESSPRGVEAPVVARPPKNHTDVPTSIAPVAVPRPRRAAWISVWIVTCFAIVAVVVVLARQSRLASGVMPGSADAVAARTIAVMPFTIRGGRINYLREGMVDLLSIGLEGAGDLRPVEPIVLLGYLANDAGESGEIVRGRAAARRFHAGRFVIGTLVDTGERLEARASLYDANGSSDTPVSVVTASADEAHIATLVDDLTRELVAVMLNSRDLRLSQLAARTTTSLIALKDYLRGSQAMRVGKYGEAGQAFRDAVRADSSFALAYYGLSMAVGWESGGADRGGTIAAEQAVRHARGLSQHDSLLLVAHFHFWNGSVVAAEQEYRRLLTAYPTDAEAWHELGEVIFHGGGVSGHALVDAREAFARVRSVDVLRMSALTHLARIEAVAHDSVALDSLSGEAERVAPGDPRTVEITTLRTFVAGDSTSRAEAIAAIASRGNRDIWSLARDLANYASAWEDAESVALLLTAPARASLVRALGWTTIAEIRAASGRPASARAAVARAAALDGGQAAYTRAYLASLPFLPATDAELRAARSGLAGWSGQIRVFGDSAEPSVGVSSEARWLILAAIDGRLGRVPVFTRGDTSVDIRTDAAILAAQSLQGPIGELGVARARATALAVKWRTVGSGQPHADDLVRLARGSLLLEIGDNAEAARWYGSFPAYGRDDAVLRAEATLGRARAEEALGDKASAARSYAEVAWLWRAAEPAVLARARGAAARARQLSASSS